jgi:hypothetical protein
MAGVGSSELRRIIAAVERPSAQASICANTSGHGLQRQSPDGGSGPDLLTPLPAGGGRSRRGPDATRSGEFGVGQGRRQLTAEPISMHGFEIHFVRPSVKTEADGLVCRLLRGSSTTAAAWPSPSTMQGCASSGAPRPDRPRGGRTKSPASWGQAGRCGQRPARLSLPHAWRKGAISRTGAGPTRSCGRVAWARSQVQQDFSRKFSQPLDSCSNSRLYLTGLHICL